MSNRSKQKTFSRVAGLLKSTHSMNTRKGELIFRIDSSGSVPQDPNSDRGEPETFAWIDSFLKPGQVMWDIGANIGVFSLYGACGGKNKILALEPSAESFATLNANIRLNKLDKHIDALCLAGSNKTEILKLFMKDPSSGASHNSIKDSTNQFGEFIVNGEQAIIGITLDAVRNVLNAPQPNHIKLDVDGKEPQILEGASLVLENTESLLIEIEGNNLTQNISMIEGLVNKAGMEEDKSWRNKGSGRNRLYVRK